MKPLLTATIVAVVALSVGAMIVVCMEPASGFHQLASNDIASDASAVALTKALTERLPNAGIHEGQPKVLDKPERGNGFTLSQPRSLYLDKDAYNQPLTPGIYQTFPYTIILGVPGRGIDNGILGTASTNNFNMPVIRPRIRAVPSWPTNS